MIVFELVLKALARSKSFSLIFILNFCLAIASLSYVQFFQTSIDASLEAKTKSLLGADLMVTSRFPITPEQIEDIKNKLPEIKNYNEGISTVSMVASTKRSRLMEVVRVEEGYPYYGGLVFDDEATYPSNMALPKADEVWVYQEVLDLLALPKGSSLKIGKEQFTITRIITDDTSKAINFSGFMPKVYLSQAGLTRAALLQFGSTARYRLHYQFKESLSNQTLETIENTLENSIDQNLRALSPNDGRDRLLRVLNFLTNFLSLVSLVSFFLGLVGLIYLYSGFLRKHQQDITILSDLGLRKSLISCTYLMHLFVLILSASLLVFVLIFSSANVAEPLLQRLIGFEFDFSFDYTFFLNALVILLGLSLSIGVPLIIPHLGRHPMNLKRLLLWFAPFVGMLLTLSHLVSPKQSIGLFVALTVLLVMVLFFSVGSLLLKRWDFSGFVANLSLSLALKNIIRHNKTSLTLFTALLLCTTFFSLIPQVGASLSTLLTQSVDERPRFFVIDAQEETIDVLKQQVKERHATLENVSPMIRGRIIKVNDIDFTKHANTHADNDLKANQKELKNRAVNLSYRNTLKPSETIVQGRAFSGRYDASDLSKPIELSVEKRYAQQRGITLGDTITFDVLGLEITTQVINIRTVNWTEFVPNFFFILQEGAIDDAPKTLLATISQGDYEATQLLLQLSDLFPSLTIIDVKNLFETFSKLVEKVTKITDTMSFYSVLVGLLMSFIIIQYQMNLQKNNILRLKMIGVTNKTIKDSFLLEFGLIALGASSLGILLGSLGSYVISRMLFESYWELRALVLLGYFICIPLLTLLIVSFFTTKVMNQKENVLFGE